MLTSLDLSYNFLGNNVGNALVNSLHMNTTLTSLRINGNQFDFEVEKALKEIIQKRGGNQFTLEVEDVLKKIMQKRGSFLDTRLDPGDDNIEELYKENNMNIRNIISTSVFGIGSIATLISSFFPFMKFLPGNQLSIKEKIEEQIIECSEHIYKVEDCEKNDTEKDIKNPFSLRFH
ncbi:13455_t:CDS:2 [Cetraspora pellucida]|uniref:13455_t:CDS:1 n=1 Tax=Cetraspora pellucida TaxID=1433469 RepID=A0A9N8ZZK3_9GLOM|nr:13455_t:CDS:2 [Cetraspora pellucida]